MINDYRFSRGQFSVDFYEFVFTGSDVKTFLDTQCTYAVSQLSNQDFHLIAILDPTGKIETYGWLLRSGEKFHYLVPPALESDSRTRLHKFLVSEDVEIEEKGIARWTFYLGEKVSGFSGIILEEPAVLSQEQVSEFPLIPKEDVELWRQLNGWPGFNAEDFTKELINNTRLFDLALVSNKGCYPGQETVSKIATRRGAAYSPVLIESSRPVMPGALTISGNKIGTAGNSLNWDNLCYVRASLLRDFRVEGMKINFQSGEDSHQGIVRYYPLLKGEPKAKALELYDLGLENFRKDDLGEAEKNLRLAISLDPSFADAYESLGVMLGRQNRYAEAIFLMEKLTEVDPHSSMAHTNLSLFLMKTGKIEEAENHKSLATLKSFKKFGDEAKEKEAAAQKAKAEEAEWVRREQMFREVLEIDAEDTLANYGLGSIAVERSEWEKARNYLEKVIIADPKYSVAYLALGRAYRGLGLKEKSRDTFLEGIKVAASKGDFMPANQMQSELDRL